MTRAIIEMQDAGICRDCEIVVVAGPDDYLYGEEKALLEVIEGNAPLPRSLPPYQHGLFATAPQLGWSAASTSGDAPRRRRLQPDPREQCGDARQRPAHPRPRRRVVPQPRNRAHAGQRRVHRRRRCHTSGRRRSGTRHESPRRYRRRRWRPASGPHDQGGLLRRHESGRPRSERSTRSSPTKG